jgi:hypothetical protein
MKVEAHIVIEGTFMVPARHAELLSEIISITSKYESGPGYIYELHKHAFKITGTILSKEYVAVMVANQKLSE